MNILIAMMNSTYTEVLGLQDSLWCTEALRFLIWIAMDNVLWTRDIVRQILKMTVFSEGHKIVAEDPLTILAQP